MGSYQKELICLEGIALVMIFMNTRNDPTVNMDILPEMFPVKPIIKVKCWIEVLKSILQKSGTHFLDSIQ